MKDQQSDIDEGFVPYLLEIKSHRQPYSTPHRIQRPTDYQPRYIYHQYIIRKQPHSILSANQSLPYFNYHISNHPKQPSQPQHPFDKYCLDASYLLIYSRNKSIKSIRNKDDHFWHQIPIHSITNYDQLQYVAVKEYQSTSRSYHHHLLQFDSCFESGNLMWVFMCKHTPNQYTLFIQNDTNTYGFNQWFYFSVRNTRQNTKYQFNIVNLRNKHSFFKEGKQILIYSLKSSALQKQYGWKYGGCNISYGKSPIAIEGTKDILFYSLSFQLEFQHDGDTVFIAMNIPYSYSKLVYRLKMLQQEANSKSIQWSQQTISYTLANNAVPYLTITTNPSSKRIILVMARQHPGQTWSSILLQSILKQLLNQSNQSKWLLDNFIIKVIPMINVDGVIYGNFRCDLGGVDLNRQWSNPSKQLHPQIYHIKQQIQKLSNAYSIQCTLDLHGHSKQYNTFSYSCKSDSISCRVLPFMMSQLNYQFHFPSCTFGISKSKASTARAIISNITNTFNVHTIESSFFGTKINTIKQPYRIDIMDQLANTINLSLKQYFNHDPLRKQAQSTITTKIASFMDYQRSNPYKDDGSQSDPSQDQMDIKQKIGRLIPIKAIQEHYGQINLIKAKLKISKRKKYVTLQRAQIVKSKNTTKIKKLTNKSNLTKKRLMKESINKQDLSKIHLSKSVSKQYISITNQKQIINYNRCKTRNNNLTINHQYDQKYPTNIAAQQCVVLNPSKTSLKKQLQQIKYKQLSIEQKKMIIPNIKIGLVDRQKKSKSVLEVQFPSLSIFSENIKKSQLLKLNDKLKNKNNLSNNQRIKNLEERKRLNKFQIKIQQKRSQKKSIDSSVKLWSDNSNRYSRENRKLHKNNY